MRRAAPAASLLPKFISSLKSGGMAVMVFLELGYRSDSALRSGG